MNFYGADWAMITIKKKFILAKKIIEKLLENKGLNEEENEFLRKEGFK